MTLVQALLAAVTAETACIIFLFGILMAKNKSQDADLAECKKERKELSDRFTALYRELWLAGALPNKEEKK